MSFNLLSQCALFIYILAKRYRNVKAIQKKKRKYRRTIHNSIWKMSHNYKPNCKMFLCFTVNSVTIILMWKTAWISSCKTLVWKNMLRSQIFFTVLKSELLKLVMVTFLIAGVMYIGFFFGRCSFCYTCEWLWEVEEGLWMHQGQLKATGWGCKLIIMVSWICSLFF